MINTAASKFVIAKIILSFLPSTLTAIVPPIIPPINATITKTKICSLIKSPPNKCPKNPINAVAETNTEDVPTAIVIGTPHNITIKGIKNDPPEIPTAPAKKPIKEIIGIISHKLTVY